MGKPLKDYIRVTTLNAIITDDNGEPILDDDFQVITTDDNYIGVTVRCDPSCYLYIGFWKYAISIG